MTAIEVACPRCASQPGDNCVNLQDSSSFHYERVEAAYRITSMESGAATQDAPTLNDFNQAADDSGLV